jgi:hypothetical protein
MPDWNAADYGPFTGASHLGLGGLDHSEIPDTCTCTWSWGPPGFRWERIGIKDDCPWHRIGDATRA